MNYITFNSPLYLLPVFFVAIAAMLFLKRNNTSILRPEPWKKMLRFLSIGLIFLGLAEPKVIMNTWNQCVLFLIDASNSISDEERGKMKDFLKLKLKEKEPGDRIGLLQFGEIAELLIPPDDISKQTLLSGFSDLMKPVAGLNYTDIESAIRVASSLFPDGFQKKIVLITDGNENKGMISNQYDELRARNIRVDILPGGGIKHGEVLLESIFVPRQVHVGNPFTLEIDISSNVTTSVEILISIDRKLVMESKIDITQGEHQIHKTPLILHESGFHSIEVNISAEQDHFFINNSADTVTHAAGRPRVLFIEDSISGNFKKSGKFERNYLQNVLVKNGIDMDSISWKNLPAEAKGFDGYGVVILNNIPSISLGSERMQTIASAVHDLGIGLIFVAGERMVGTSGYARTPIETALPVKLAPSAGKRPSSIDLILVMDKSGSMSEGGGDSKIRMAIDATRSIIEIFNEEDQLGVIVFDSEPHIIAPLGSIKNQDKLVNNIHGIIPRGSTDFYPALVQAYQWVKASDASYKHIILLSDGKTRKRDFKGLIQKMVEKDISISVIGIGKDTNISLLKEIANTGKGRYFQIEEDLLKLSDIFKLDTLKLAAGSSSIEETFTPRFKEPDPILNGIPYKMPEMHGYMVTSPKKTAIIPVVSHRGDPIIGFWRYGLGKTAIFTGDEGSRWSRDWITWEGFGRLWLQLVKRTMRSQAAGDNFPIFHVQGNQVEVQYEVKEKREAPWEMVARVFPPDGKTFELDILQSSPGIYRGTIDDLRPGRYRVFIVKKNIDKYTEISRGSFVVNGALEFRKLYRNMTLLEEIAAQTKGRILSQEDIIFEKDRKGVKEYIPIWAYLFMVAVIVFLIDVGVHR